MGSKVRGMRRALTLLVAVAALSGTIGAPSGALAAGATPEPTLTEPTGKPSTNGTVRLDFAGSVEPGAAKIKARVLRLDADGNVIDRRDNGQSFNDDVTSLLNIAPDGTISGGAIPGHIPSRTESLALLVEVQNPDGSLAEGRSAPLPYDNDDPAIVRYELIGPDTIRVVFSEPVTYMTTLGSGSSGSALDWTVTLGDENNPVMQVTGTGAERFLTLFEEYAEDDTPSVRFFVRNVDRHYADIHDHRINNDITRVALDRILPAMPRIASMGGRTSNQVIANERNPIVVVEGLSTGHSAQIFEEDDGVAGLSGGDRVLGPAERESGGRASLEYVGASEGNNVLYAAAYDPSLNRSQSASGQYILDTVVPSVVSAEPVDLNYLQVVFTEPVFGTGNIGDWKVGGGSYPVAGVTGDGNARLLQVTGVPAGTAVAYSPVTGARLVDAAGNVLGPFTKATTTAQPGSSTGGGGGGIGGGDTTSPSPSPTATPTTTPGGGSGGTPTPTPTQTPTPIPSPTPTETPGGVQEELQARAAEDDAPVGACQDVSVTFYRNGNPAPGENIDVTLTDGVEFCDGTEGRHAEAFTDSSGTAVFRILSRSTRTISILTWHDKDDDDLPDAGEKKKTVELTWEFDGARTLTLKGKRKVRSGARVRLRGTVTAVMRRCEVDAAVEIVRQRGSGVRVIDAVLTKADGSFSKRVRVRKTATYFARAQSIGGCDEGYSQGLFVKALRRK